MNSSTPIGRQSVSYTLTQVETGADLRIVLDDLQFLSRNAARTALQKLEEILPRLRVLNDPALLCRILLIQYDVFSALGMHNKLEAIFFELQRLEHRIHDPAVKALCLKFFCACYSLSFSFLQDLPKAYSYSIRAFACADAADDDRVRSNVLINQGLVHIAACEFDRALECFLRALEFAQRHETELCAEEAENAIALRDICETLFTNLANIGNTYEVIGESDRAYRYYRSALLYAKRADNGIYIAHIHASIGRTLTRLHKYRAALAAYEKAVSLCRVIEERPLNVLALSGMAQCYRLLGREDLASQHIAEAFCLCRATKGLKSRRPFASLFHVDGDIKYEAGQLAEAERSYLRAERLFRQAAFKESILETYRCLIRLYTETGEAAKLARYEKKYYQLREEMMSMERQRNIAQIEQREALRAVEKEHSTLLHKLEESEAKAERLEKEISEVRTRLIRQQESLKKLQSFLRQHLKEAGLPIRKAAARLMEAIDAAGNDPDDIQAFEFEFEQSSREFSQLLLKRCTELTPTELRICNYTRLGLPVKQIAELMYVTVDTIKTHRKNARRKLSLKTSENLESYLIGIG